MKTKLLTCLILAIGFFTSCVQKPKEENVRKYLDSLQSYHPYSAEESFIFVNDSLGRTWEAKAYNKGNKTYPHTTISLMDEFGTKSYGDWYALIDAPFVEKSMTPNEDNMGNIHSEIAGNSVNYTMIWDCKIFINQNERYVGEKIDEKFPIGDFSAFQDALVIPIVYKYDTIKKHLVNTHEGGYVRIIKHQGMTDFSTDGKTVWRRVKQ